ncbi:Nucleoside triphosphate pyrophosphohydrolase [wastewater metagenome]|uniref:Nucleoside triphosphate pyrophosphohydrolase n=2 Tax=unclassified sequences TaxID=12908 RepID=A0A5B8R8W1_9ZZZZ|nr:nucleoside triphosphate pyrophosphohydrolase [Arhodomonas sp. KWT]QEA05160.1 nucleoside triphosphate pyrophosphohydrolase [uncultured organism]
MPQHPVDRLIEIMAALRNPDGGCPWDLEQDWQSIVPHTLEEAYEVADTIERGDYDHLRDELGDLLFQVVYYARFAAEEGRFDFHDVASAIADKIVRRHPHVFGEAEERDADSQTRAWEAIKAAERAQRADGEGREPGLLDDVPRTLPALSRSIKLQKRAARVGFDWEEPRPVIAKLREELAELEEAMASGDGEHIHEEYGDLLFACANLGRHLGSDPEQALRAANDKFERRFRGLESVLAKAGRQPGDCDFDTLEAAYQQAKARDNAAGAGD